MVLVTTCILKLLFGMGRQMFMWNTKLWLYVQNRRYICVSAVPIYLSVCFVAGGAEQDGVSVVLAWAQGEMLS